MSWRSFIHTAFDHFRRYPSAYPCALIAFASDIKRIGRHVSPITCTANDNGDWLIIERYED